VPIASASAKHVASRFIGQQLNKKLTPSSGHRISLKLGYMVRQSRSSAILIHSPILLHVLQTKLKFTRLALALWQFRTIVCEKKYKTTLLQKYLQLIKN
jgi:hypothetical protein